MYHFQCTRVPKQGGVNVFYEEEKTVTGRNGQLLLVAENGPLCLTARGMEYAMLDHRVGWPTLSKYACEYQCVHFKKLLQQ